MSLLDVGILREKIFVLNKLLNSHHFYSCVHCLALYQLLITAFEMQNLQTSALGQLALIRAEAIMITKVCKL